MNLVAKSTYLGIDRNPIITNDSVMTILYYYDSKGNIIKISFTKSDGKLDKISKQLFSNQGTNTFILGPDK